MPGTLFRAMGKPAGLPIPVRHAGGRAIRPKANQAQTGGTGKSRMPAGRTRGGNAAQRPAADRLPRKKQAACCQPQCATREGAQSAPKPIRRKREGQAKAERHARRAHKRGETLPNSLRRTAFHARNRPHVASPSAPCGRARHPPQSPSSANGRDRQKLNGMPAGRVKRGALPNSLMQAAGCQSQCATRESPAACHGSAPQGNSATYLFPPKAQQPPASGWCGGHTGAVQGSASPDGPGQCAQCWRRAGRWPPVSQAPTQQPCRNSRPVRR